MFFCLPLSVSNITSRIVFFHRTPCWVANSMAVKHNPMEHCTQTMVTAILVIWLAATGDCHGECMAEEREALLHFKSALDDPSGRLRFWKGFDCCSWPGLQCDEANGHVIKLDLGNPNGGLSCMDCKLNGTLSNALFRLHHLQFLDLSWNDFSESSIPAEIGGFKWLRYLNLSAAGVGGIIPPELGNLSRLEHLDLSDNEFSGFMPSEVGRLFGLQHLALSGNYMLDMQKFSWLANMTVLRYLSLNSLNLTMERKYWDEAFHAKSHLQRLSMLGTPGVILSSLLNLTSLSHLRLGSSDLSTQSISVVSRAQWPQLTILDVSGTQISGMIPSALFNKSPLLTELFLNDNQIEGQIPVSIGNLSRLTTLDLRGNKLNASIPPSLGLLSALLYLSLADNQLNGIIPSSLTRLSSLKHLDLSLNKLNASIPPSMGLLSSLHCLALSGNQLSGSIPPSLGNLSSLKYLYLYDNQLSESIPSSLGNLSSLKYLYLYDNQLSGSIPPSLGNLSSLKYLHLSANQLSGSIPPSLGNLSSLQEFMLQNNSVSGSIPPSFCHLSSLIHLDVSQNQLNGSLHPSFRLPSALQTLDLSFNILRGHISFSLFQNLADLSIVDLSDNHFTFNTTFLSVPTFQFFSLSLRSCNIAGALPSVLSTQFDLYYLDLSRNNIGGDIPPWLWELPLIHYLNLSNNLLQGQLPPILNMRRSLGAPGVIIDLKHNYLEGPLPLTTGVSQLHLSDNLFNGSIPLRMANDLVFLSVANNHLRGGIPPSICEDSILLQGLDLSGNDLSGVIPSTLGYCSKLLILNLVNNNLEGDIPQQLGSLYQLQTLRMNGNSLSGSLHPLFRSWKSLEIMDLGYNKLNGTIPTWISDLLSLRVLVLKGNDFGGNIPPEITRLQNLQILDLSCNFFTGNIPINRQNSYNAMRYPSNNKFQQFGKYELIDGQPLPTMKEDEAKLTNKGQEMYYVEEILYQVACIDLSNNDLSGNIPREFGYLQGLRFFNISKNRITGEIPETLGAMLQLESLDISRNQLSGEIPQSMQSLTYLAYLDVSDNRLTGRIPRGNQFLTFNASSFEGNKDLCGLQVNKNCENGTLTEDHTGNDDEEEESGFEIPWWNVGFGLSFGGGFAVVYFVLAINRQWRRNYFALMDRMAIIPLLERMARMGIL